MAFAAARMIKDRKDQENRKRSTDEMQNSMYKKMVMRFCSQIAKISLTLIYPCPNANKSF